MGRVEAAVIEDRRDRAVLAGEPLPMDEIAQGMIGALVLLVLGFAFSARMLTESKSTDAAVLTVP